MPDDTTWQDVAAALTNRWLAGPGNRGWEREQVAGFIAECQEDGLDPHMAIVGLRASTSDFIPSVGGVKRLYRESLPPMTVSELQAATERHLERRRSERLAELTEPEGDDAPGPA